MYDMQKIISSNLFRDTAKWNISVKWSAHKSEKLGVEVQFLDVPQIVVITQLVEYRPSKSEVVGSIPAYYTNNNGAYIMIDNLERFDKSKVFWFILIKTLSQKYNYYNDGSPGGANKKKKKYKY